MTDLKIDTTILVEAGQSLRVVATEFENANANSNRAADAVGSELLAARVTEFAHNWDDKRAKMMENIATLAEVSQGIGTTFDELEANFVSSLRGEGE